MKRKLVLADSDWRYLKEISCYFMEKVPQFEIITFTKEEKLREYFTQGGEADLLAVDETFVKERLEALTPGLTRIMLSVSMNQADGFETVKKYQKLETLAGQILLKYAQDSNTLETVKGNAETKIVSFYSPAGGTGKTTLALSLSAAAVKTGLHVLYMNLEEISSVDSALFEEGEGGLSAVFLALKTKGMNVGIKLKTCVRTEPAAGFSFLSGVDSISEYEEIDGEDVTRLLKAARELSDYDLIVTDHSSGFTKQTQAALEEADMIFVPTLMDEGSLAKLERFLRESGIHSRYDGILQKMNLIFNRAGEGSRTEADFSGIRSRIPCCAAVAEAMVFTDRQRLLSSGDALIPVMNPMLLAAGGKA